MKENLNLFLKFFLTARRFCVIIDLGENQVRRGRGQKKVIIVLLLANRRFAPRRKKDLQLQMQVVAFINVLLIIIALLLIGAKKKKKKKKAWGDPRTFCRRPHQATQGGIQNLVFQIHSQF